MFLHERDEQGQVGGSEWFAARFAPIKKQTEEFVLREQREAEFARKIDSVAPAPAVRAARRTRRGDMRIERRYSAFPHSK